MYIFRVFLFLLMGEQFQAMHSLNDSFTDYPCNIQKVNVQSIEEAGNIIKHFPDVPVIFVGARNRNHVLAHAASEDTLREMHGDSIVTLASSNTYSHDTIDMTISQYLDLLARDAHLSKNAKANETYYLFGNNFVGLFKSLEQLYVLPPCLHCRKAGRAVFLLALMQCYIAFVLNHVFPSTIVQVVLSGLCSCVILSSRGHCTGYRGVEKWCVLSLPWARLCRGYHGT